MSPNGPRAWRAAAKKLRRKLGRRWRSPEAKWSGKRWSELVPDIAAHRGHFTGAWFRRHGSTEQGLQTLDASHLVRVYVGLWGTVDGDYVTYDASPRPLTARSLVGMSQSARKRRSRAVAYLVIVDVTFIEHAETWANAIHSKLFHQRKFPRHQWDLEQYAQVRAKYRIGERLRPCPGCHTCMPGVKGWHIDKVRGRFKMPTIAWSCDGSGVLPARRSK